LFKTGSLVALETPERTPGEIYPVEGGKRGGESLEFVVRGGFTAKNS
jgi:hypothetical protein